MNRRRFVRETTGAVLGAGLLSISGCSPPRSSGVVVGAKNFTEQVVLGELLAQAMEALGEKVERRFYLAGSYIAHQALISGRIDVYVEYTGTALSAVLKQPVDRDAARVLATIRRLYRDQYGVRVAEPLGFENTFAMVVRAGDADRLKLTTLSNVAAVAGQLRLGVGYEFEERADGLRGLEEAYGLHFAGTPRVMDLGLLYRALGAQQVDIVSGNSTDGAIRGMGLRVLADDRHYFPPYQAVPLVREDALRRHPALQRALDALAGKINEEQMQAMNHAVEGEHRDPADVAREFLRGLVGRG